MTGLSARYFDPLTRCFYSSPAAFKALRSAFHRMREREVYRQLLHLEVSIYRIDTRSLAPSSMSLSCPLAPLRLFVYANLWFSLLAALLCFDPHSVSRPLSLLVSLCPFLSLPFSVPSPRLFLCCLGLVVLIGSSCLSTHFSCFCVSPLLLFLLLTSLFYTSCCSHRRRCCCCFECCCCSTQFRLRRRW